MKPRSFTQAELSKYNGKNGAPVYIAYQGVVYDVSNSYFWRNGVHHVVHSAGHDLTGELPDAPHGAETLKRFPIIGFIDNKD